MLGHPTVLATHGLTLFFALSGFLLVRPFAAAILAGDRLPSIGGYAERNRFLRIYPAYLAIFVVVSFVAGAAYTTGSGELAGHASIGYLTNPAAIGLNLLLIQTYLPGFLFTGVGTAWSLTAEIAFYVVLPVLAIAAVAVVRRKVSRVVALTLPALLMIAFGWATTALIAGQKAGLGGASADQYSWGQTWTAVLDRSLLSQADLVRLRDDRGDPGRSAPSPRRHQLAGLGQGSAASEQHPRHAVRSQRSDGVVCIEWWQAKGVGLLDPGHRAAGAA